MLLHRPANWLHAPGNVPEKGSHMRHYYPLEAGEYAAATLHGLYLAIKRGSLANLDNLTGWVLTTSCASITATQSG